jgi:hypothetical protein
VRIAVATARDEPAAAVPALCARTEALMADHERALTLLDRAAGELRRKG